jgi:hypothetical protein
MSLGTCRLSPQKCKGSYSQLQDFCRYANFRRRETDELTRKTYAVYDSGPPETHRVLPTADDEDLLQLWAKKRGAPNEAEMYMLAKYIGVDVYNIYDWCKYTKVSKEWNVH